MSDFYDFSVPYNIFLGKYELVYNKFILPISSLAFLIYLLWPS